MGTVVLVILLDQDLVFRRELDHQVHDQADLVEIQEHQFQPVTEVVTHLVVMAVVTVKDLHLVLETVTLRVMVVVALLDKEPVLEVLRVMVVAVLPDKELVSEVLRDQVDSVSVVHLVITMNK